MDGLGEQWEVVGGVARIVDQRAELGMAREEQDLAIRHNFFNLDREFNSVHPWHHDVSDEEFGRDELRDLKRFGAVVGCVSGEVSFAKNCHECVCDEMFVVYDHDYRMARSSDDAEGSWNVGQRNDLKV